MSETLAVLAECQRLGATFRVEGDTLKVRAPAPLPLALMESLRLYKAKLLEALRKRKSASERLANGAAWLTAAWAAIPPGQEPDGRFDRAVGAWADLCESFYGEMGGQGCALGQDGPCKPDSFIQCTACLADSWAKHAPEGWTAAARFDAPCVRCGGRIFWSRDDVRQCVGCFRDGPVAETAREARK